MSVERTHVFRFGVFEVDQRARELRKQGVRVRLQEQPFQVLIFLLERAGDVVARDELRQRLWPASVYVDFDHGLNNAIARLREALGDAAATPHFIETLPRLGYRFIYPMGDVPAHPFRDAPAQLHATTNAPAELRRRGVPQWVTSRIVWIFGVVAAVAVVGLLVGAWSVRQRADEAVAKVVPSGEPSIAVLPFVSVDSDIDSAHFADGLSEEMIVKLASIRGLRVVGRTSSFYFKGKQESLGIIAQTLKVNYLLEGSVRRAGEHLRVTAQLIDASDGSRLWSEAFDRDLTDIFEVQQDLAFAVATALRVKLMDADEQRLRKRGTQDAEAYRLYVIANAYLRGISVNKDSATAKQLFERAIALDPKYAAAYAGLAQYHFQRAWTSLDDVEGGMRLGQEAAQRAVALDRESSEALQARANFAMWRYRFMDDFQAYTQAQGDYRRAIELDPANETVLFDYGRAALWHQPELAQSLFEQLVERDPLAHAARGMIAAALSHRDMRDLAREQLQELNEKILDSQGHTAAAVYEAGIEQDLGHLDKAVVLMRDAVKRGGVELPVWLWSLSMSLGDRVAVREPLDFGNTGLGMALSEAAAPMMHDRYDAAYESLEHHRGEFPQSHILDLPTARLALINGKPEQALAILTGRIPDLFEGIEPVNAQNIIPALDLVAAWVGTNNQTQSRQLIDRIAAFLDGPTAPRIPMFVYLRARTHALAGESELALQALDRAYEAGFRTTWALDLHPQPLLYLDPIDVDPAFEKLRTEPRYVRWLERISADNARQREQLNARDAVKPAA